MKIDSIGIDKGSTYTKDSNGNIFKSAIALANNNFNISQNEIFAFEGNYYVIGDKALKKNFDFATDLQKTDQYHTKVCIYYALSKFQFDNYIEYNLVNLGLPIGKYFAFKEKYKQMFDLKNNVPVMVDNRIKHIRINKIEVIPESAGIFYSENIEEFENRKVIVVDIGGLSVDVSVYEDCEITDVYDTFDMGMMHPYQQIAGKINNLNDTNLSAWDIEKIFKQGLIIKGEDKTSQFQFIAYDILSNHTKNIYNKLKLITNINEAYTVLLGGGGAVVLEKYFKELIPHVRLIKDYQFANAKIFNEIGKVMYL